MDWRYNTIWFEQIEQEKIFQQDFKENTIATENKNFESAEYAIIWHLKRELNSFNTLSENDKLSYLELNWANVKNFDGIEKFKHLKRLELHYCVKLENDFGLSRLKNSLEYLHINTSKKFKFSNELIQLKKLKVLSLNTCGPIDNLNFLDYLPNLIDFRFVDTDILDGNLQPILDHPIIKSVGFKNKKHYNIKDKTVNLALANKSQSAYKTIIHQGQYSTYRYDYE
jgi:hypothetical protein